MHGTTRRVPRDVFEAIERAEMLPPPEALYDVPLFVDNAKVHPDHHIQVARALYSVPTRYLRKHVRVRADRKVVKIYFGTELIKMHERQPPGGRSTDPADYPADKAVYALRDVDALRAKAKEKGVHVGIYAERLLDGPLPWTKMRQAYALLSYCDKYGDGRVEAMCQSALAFDVVNVSRVAAMLKSAAKAPRPAPGSNRSIAATSLHATGRAVRDAPVRGQEQQGGRLMDAATPALNSELFDALKRLRLGRIAASLPERLVLADKQEMPFDELLLMIFRLRRRRRVIPIQAQAEDRRCRSAAQGARDEAAVPPTSLATPALIMRRPAGRPNHRPRSAGWPHDPAKMSPDAPSRGSTSTSRRRAQSEAPSNSVVRSVSPAP